MANEQKHLFFEDDNGDKIVEIKVKTSPDNVFPMKFKSWRKYIERIEYGK